MAQKRVSFKVAKAIKEAGYPQDKSSSCYNAYTGEFHYTSCLDSWLKDGDYIDAPTYLDVWLWLWREKKIFIEPAIHFDSVKGYYFTAFIISDNITKHVEASDSEEAIIAAIDYLVDNDLIK